MLSFFFLRRLLLLLLHVRWQSVKDRVAVTDASSRLHQADPSTRRRRRPAHRLSPVKPLTREDQSSQLVKNPCSHSFTRPEMVSIVSCFFLLLSALSVSYLLRSNICLCGIHTHTQSARTTIRSCYKSRRNPNRELDRCLLKIQAFPAASSPGNRGGHERERAGK